MIKQTKSVKVAEAKLTGLKQGTDKAATLKQAAPKNPATPGFSRPGEGTAKAAGLKAPAPAIADVQGYEDTRRLDIDKVGIKAIRHPVRVKDRSGGEQHTIATFNMYVYLPHKFKGTHMSRFVEILNHHATEINVESFKEMLPEMIQKLDSEAGTIEMSFPYFMAKEAPVTGVRSLMDYNVTFIGEILKGKVVMTLKVVVPVTSLCPCSKQISDYGAHNQRSDVTVKARLAQGPYFVWIEDIIDLVESVGSCPLFPLLKRPDEKWVTEHAFDNPKFVEDIVRDAASLLNQDKRIVHYTVESENFESIHNHNAYAMIERDKSKKQGG